jgi:hypothetical protein
MPPLFKRDVSRSKRTSKRFTQARCVCCGTHLLGEGSLLQCDFGPVFYPSSSFSCSSLDWAPRDSEAVGIWRSCLLTFEDAVEKTDDSKRHEISVEICAEPLAGRSDYLFTTADGALLPALGSSADEVTQSQMETVLHLPLRVISEGRRSVRARGFLKGRTCRGQSCALASVRWSRYAGLGMLVPGR